VLELAGAFRHLLARVFAAVLSIVALLCVASLLPLATLLSLVDLIGQGRTCASEWV